MVCGGGTSDTLKHLTKGHKNLSPVGNAIERVAVCDIPRDSRKLQNSHEKEKYLTSGRSTLGRDILGLLRHSVSGLMPFDWDYRFPSSNENSTDSRKAGKRLSSLLCRQLPGKCSVAAIERTPKHRTTTPRRPPSQKPESIGDRADFQHCTVDLDYNRGQER